MSALLMNSSVIVFMLGLIAEQIASLRLEKSDRLFTTQDDSQYAEFAQLCDDSQVAAIDSDQVIEGDQIAEKKESRELHPS
jgi:hypothetical protein